MAKLFGLFSKIRDKRVENPLGVGLGLAICKQLVELMRGQIHVTSVYGRGTKFFFTAIHGRSTEEEMADAVKERDLAQKDRRTGGAEVLERDTGRVLVVEDNEFNMEVAHSYCLLRTRAVLPRVLQRESYIPFLSIISIISSNMPPHYDHRATGRRGGHLHAAPLYLPPQVVRCMLENEGNQVSLATNGQEACEAYQAAVERGEPFEVIFMDCNMPVLDGYEATKKIRKMQAEP